MHAPALSFMRDPQPATSIVAAVREEALRALADLGEALPLTAWRGRSGRRYVFSIFDAGDPPPLDGGGVLLAVGRNGHDGAVLLGSMGLAAQMSGDGGCPLRSAQTREGISEAHPADARDIWCDVMRERGACEWHLHLLARTPLAQEAMRADLACLPRTTA
ncbi:hypothetical protein [Saliniramus sp.]|uniref:hypothetical protein n=1 Tax=Saliniramus sp. TaxID=2986772 RepID=UPI002C0A0D73|nr:hypothetical protein [Saliniramus sp.]HMB09562.1 hypothetical protein [Saliniramus sp.]